MSVIANSLSGIRNFSGVKTPTNTTFGKWVQYGNR